MREMLPIKNLAPLEKTRGREYLYTRSFLTGLILSLALIVVFSFAIESGRAQFNLPIFVKEEQPLKAPRPLFVEGELIVKFKRGINENAIKGLEREQGAVEKHISPISGFRVLKLAKGRSVPDAVSQFSNNPLVEYAEPNYIAYASFIPNDTFYDLQWHFDNPVHDGIHMEDAWDVSTGDLSVVVAVIDTGVAYEDFPAPPHCHIDTYQAFGGSGNSWWCGLDDPSFVNPPGYGNGWRDYLQHEFDLSSTTGTVTFSYNYRHDLEFTQGIAYDKAFTEISTNGGADWTELKEYTRNTKGGQNKWKSDSFDITSFTGGTVLIRFRVFTDDTFSDEDGNINTDGALFIDNILLEDGNGTIFSDDVESGAGSWEATQYKRAPDLAGTNFLIIPGSDFVNVDDHPNDDASHGTHVAGTIAQSTNNSLGAAGVAFGTTIMPIKVLGADGSGTFAQVIDGIDLAVANGADVINMSLSASVGSAGMETAVMNAFNAGVVVVAACGNENTSDCEFPAAYNSYVIAVGATEYDETRAPYSSFGPSLDIVAPGGNTGVDDNGDGFADGVLQNTFDETPVDFAYWFFQGTSMATPHIAGVAALLLAKDPSLTPTQVRTAMESTADDLGTGGRDNTFGWGLVNAKAALDSIAAVSITISTDGAVAFGVQPLGSVEDTTGSGINDVETISITTGPADLDVRSSNFSDGANTWTLAGTVGADQVKWEFSPNGSSWTVFSTADTLFELANNVAEAGNQNMYLRINLPSDSSSALEHSSTVTVVATSP